MTEGWLWCSKRIRRITSWKWRSMSMQSGERACWQRRTGGTGTRLSSRTWSITSGYWARPSTVASLAKLACLSLGWWNMVLWVQYGTVQCSAMQCCGGGGGGFHTPVFVFESVKYVLWLARVDYLLILSCLSLPSSSFSFLGFLTYFFSYVLLFGFFCMDG